MKWKENVNALFHSFIRMIKIAILLTSTMDFFVE